MDLILTEEDYNQMEEIHKDFSKQHDKFMLDTSSESNLQTILRAHLYIEYELEKMLLSTLVHPEILKGKLRFIDKVRFVFALDLLPLETMSSILKINKLRNAFAHELEYSFSEADFDQLMESFSEEQKKKLPSYLSSETVIDISEKLKMALFTVWIELYEVNNISKELAEKLQRNLENIKKNKKVI
ncbi:hypothetical protein [Paenibacillus xylanivorans]|uniref:hypothetical protein n=1 Tax=Paenibacillus xylanivorans TaxID=1705561 RepID=UPI0006B17184|nr:hypothetical protein [Paenibacillus xylanivorans]